jgi:hypothetical protein
MMLMPAGVMIALILASLALDRALVFGAQRDLVATAQAAANDAVALGVDPDELRANGLVVLDPGRVGRAVAAVVAEDAETDATWDIRGTTVIVHLERRVHYILSPALPGAPRTELLSATAEAELRRR